MTEVRVTESGESMSFQGLMKGKRGLIMGLANDRSLAWGIARALGSQGAELAFSYQGEALEIGVDPVQHRELHQDRPGQRGVEHHVGEIEKLPVLIVVRQQQDFFGEGQHRSRSVSQPRRAPHGTNRHFIPKLALLHRRVICTDEP